MKNKSGKRSELGSIYHIQQLCSLGWNGQMVYLPSINWEFAFDAKT